MKVPPARLFVFHQPASLASTTPPNSSLHARLPSTCFKLACPSKSIPVYIDGTSRWSRFLFKRIARKRRDTRMQESRCVLWEDSSLGYSGATCTLVTSLLFSTKFHDGPMASTPPVATAHTVTPVLNNYSPTNFLTRSRGSNLKRTPAHPSSFPRIS